MKTRFLQGCFIIKAFNLLNNRFYCETVLTVVNGDSLIVLRGLGQARHWFKTHLQTIRPVVVGMQNRGRAGLPPNREEPGRQM